jgi:ABC-2 type transport system permease protein
MTWILVRKLLRDVRWAFLTVAIILFVFSAFWVKICQRITTEIAPFFNSIALMQNIDRKTVDEIVFKGPGKISQAIMGGSEIQFDRPNDFLAAALLHPVIIILCCLWCVGRAGGAVSGELDRGTMELLLSQPVPRNRLILAHFLVDCLLIPLLCLSIFAGTQYGLWLVGPFNVDFSQLDSLPPQFQMFLNKGPKVLEVSATRQAIALTNLAALLFATSGLTMALSALGRSRWRTLGISTLVGVVMFITNVLGQMSEVLSFMRPFSVFYYYQPQKIWLKNEWFVDLGDAWAYGQPLATVPVLAVLLLTGTVSYLLALTTFTRRDLPAPL